VTSRTTRSIPWHTRWSASSVTAANLAVTFHTFCTRRTLRDSCGTRVHTIPESLATSIAAARATSSAGSPARSSPCSVINRPHLPARRVKVRLPGGREEGTETLIGVLAATVRNPLTGPRRQTNDGLIRPKESTASRAARRRSFHAHAAIPRTPVTNRDCGASLIVAPAGRGPAGATIGSLDGRAADWCQAVLGDELVEARHVGADRVAQVLQLRLQLRVKFVEDLLVLVGRDAVDALDDAVQ
jgi:hypothetical protein